MNDTKLLPNHKMTKSYLLESDPYLKTSSKTSPFALSNEDSSLRSANIWNNFQNQQQQQQQQQQQPQQQHQSSAIPSDRPMIKPLAMHNVPSNVPPIAYINGNSVRPVRSRHYSQQQTVIHTNNGNANNVNVNVNINNTSSSSNASSNQGTSEKKANSGIKVAAGDMHHYAESNENGVNGYDDGNGGGNAHSTVRDFRNNKNGMSMAPKSLVDGKVRVQQSLSANGNNGAARQQQSSNQQQQQKQQQQGTKSRQSPSSSLRDYVTNIESKCFPISIPFHFSRLLWSIQCAHNISCKHWRKRNTFTLVFNLSNLNWVVRFEVKYIVVPLSLT